MIINNNKSPKVYGHSSCLVVPDNIIASNAFNIYKFPDTDYLSKKNKKNIIRGIYIFGGKSKEINSLNNNLWILLIGQEPLQWIKAETKGIQPSLTDRRGKILKAVVIFIPSCSKRLSA